MQSDTRLGIEKIAEKVESYNDEENKEDNIESKEKDEKLEDIKSVKERNRYRICIVRNEIKKTLWMLENEVFYKIIENLSGSEWIENVRYRLKIELNILELLVEKKKERRNKWIQFKGNPLYVWERKSLSF